MLQCADSFAVQYGWSVNATGRYVASDNPSKFAGVLPSADARTFVYRDGLVQHIDASKAATLSKNELDQVYLTVITELLLIGSADLVITSAGGFAVTGVFIAGSQIPVRTMEDCVRLRNRKH